MIGTCGHGAAQLDMVQLSLRFPMRLEVPHLMYGVVSQQPASLALGKCANQLWHCYNFLIIVFFQ